jgi:rod shape-determining protein MreC
MRSSQVSPLYRFSLFLVFSIALMIVDHRSNILKPARTLTSLVNIPFESVVRMPDLLTEAFKSYYPDDTLHQQYEELKQIQTVLETRLQRYDSLIQENERLSKLLSASRRSADEVLLTEIVEVGLEPLDHKIVVNRGVESGVYLGQAAIAPDGILGQVSGLGYRRSVITLITNSSHGLPVQIQRNGLRTIIQGSGKPDQVRVPFLASQADIRQGDLLVTSGMGGRFPVGYKVAEITGIVKDANEAFLNVTATTTAKIGFTKEVLLLWSKNVEPVFLPHTRE